MRRKSNYFKALCVIFILLVSYSLRKGTWRGARNEQTDHKDYVFLDQSKTSSSRDAMPLKCHLDWRSPMFSDTFYEEPEYGSSYFKQRNFFTSPTVSNPVYSDTLIKLNPDRFVLPILKNGPNNQLIGLREAAFVAIKLNRTLVIPKFFKHSSDSQSKGYKDSFVFPGHRIEVDSLCKFMSCVTLKQFQKSCGRKIEAILYLRSYSHSDMRRFESSSGMNLSDVGEIKSVEFVPKYNVSNGQRFRRTFHPQDIRKLFYTEDRCVIYPYPLYNFHVSGKSLKEATGVITKPISKVDETLNGDLFISLIYYTRIPKYIVSMAQTFLIAVMGNNPFLSVHWRFNQGDFLKRCRTEAEERNVPKRRLCKSASLIQPEDIAEAITEHVLNLTTLTKQKIQHVYIAAPTSERQLIQDVAKILRQRQGWRCNYAEDLEKFMKRRYSSCNFMERHFNDILSTTEMEICAKSTGFLGSLRSSWTDNVFLARESRSRSGRPVFDGDIFALSVKSLSRRTNGF